MKPIIYHYFAQLTLAINLGRLVMWRCQCWWWMTHSSVCKGLQVILYTVTHIGTCHHALYNTCYIRHLLRYLYANIILSCPYKSVFNFTGIGGNFEFTGDAIRVSRSVHGPSSSSLAVLSVKFKKRIHFPFGDFIWMPYHIVIGWLLVE